MKTFKEFLNEDLNPHDGFRNLPTRTTMVKLIKHLEKYNTTILRIYIKWINNEKSQLSPANSLVVMNTSDYGYNKGTPWSISFTGSASYMSSAELINYLTSEKIKSLIENDFPCEVRCEYDYDTKENKKVVKVISID